MLQAFLVRRILDHAEEVYRGGPGVRADARFTSLAGLPGAAGVTLQEFKHWAALVRSQKQKRLSRPLPVPCLSLYDQTGLRPWCLRRANEVTLLGHLADCRSRMSLKAAAHATSGLRIASHKLQQ